MLFIGRRRSEVVAQGITATESLVERFGLFTIIVLGEVVVGVVDGLAAVGPDALSIATGLIAMVVGFGFWWIYFDLVGRRLPRNDGPALVDLDDEPPADRAVPSSLTLGKCCFFGTVSPP